MTFHSTLEQVPDGVKVATAIAAPALSFLGVTVQEWTFVLSAIVSLLFIIEKFSILMERWNQLSTWMKGKHAKRKKRKEARRG